MKNMLFGWLIACFAISCIQGQTTSPVIHKTLDEIPLSSSDIMNQIQESEYIHIGFTPTFSKGLKGLALDLTDDVEVRIPIILNKNETTFYDKGFSISVWIRTKPSAIQGTPIMSNKKNDDRRSAGWILGTTEKGGWYFNISDGKTNFDYEPTSEKQAINDGKWHHLGVSAATDKKEIRFFYDGKNVAIYNIDGLDGCQSELHTVIGGSDEYSDWGSRREWMAFNGWIDEVKIWDYPVTIDTIEEEYLLYNSSLPEKPVLDSPTLKTQIWNIWHGGRRYGKYVGVQRTIDILKQENADVIGLVETYGSGAIIADSLGYYFYLISSNLSIMSRYPIEETVKVFKPFFSGGAILNLGKDKKLTFFNIWLNSGPDVCELFHPETDVNQFLGKEEKTRQAELTTILSEIKSYTANTEQVPVIMAGDYNCGSHLDWTERTKELHFGKIIDWKTSQMMANEGFTDSFRKMNPDPLKDPGFTWSPLINPATNNQNCIRDRIDFIYYKGDRLTPYRSRTLDNHPKFWPSDHASVITWFYYN